MCVGMRPKLPPLVVGKRSHHGKIHFYVGPSCAMAEEMKGRVIGGEGVAEEYFSPFRRAEIGIHHHIAGAYLLRYAQESSWRENNRPLSTKTLAAPPYPKKRPPPATGGKRDRGGTCCAYWAKFSVGSQSGDP